MGLERLTPPRVYLTSNLFATPRDYFLTRVLAYERFFSQSRETVVIATSY